MAKSGFEITGFDEIDGRLVEFQRVVFPAEMRKGTRDAAKLVEAEFKTRCPVNEGVMRDSTAVRSIPRSRIRIGHTVKILRERYFRLYEARYGKPPSPRKGETEPFFVPAVVELGDKDTEADGSLRGALYDNENAVKVEFAHGMLRAINHPKVKVSN